MQIIKMFSVVNSALLFVIIIGFSCSTYANDLPPHGTFISKNANIHNAIENYSLDVQPQLIGISIDSNIQTVISKIYCGEQANVWLEIIGNYEDGKGNMIKRDIVDAIIMIDSPRIEISKKEKQGGKIFYLLNVPTIETKGEVGIKVNYGDKTAENIFKYNFINKPEWMEKQYFSLFGGSLGMYGLDINIYLGELSPFIGAAIYFRKKSEQNDRLIMGIEVGPKLFVSKIGNAYIFTGINVGFDVDSYGGPGFMFGPSDAEVKNYIGPNIGLKMLLGQLAVLAQIEQIYYGNNESMMLFRCGVGI